MINQSNNKLTKTIVNNVFKKLQKGDKNYSFNRIVLKDLP